MLMPSIFGENLFDDFMSDFPFFDDRDLRKTERKLYGHNAKRLMKTDIKETDSGFELEMDLPGFKKDEIKVSLDNGYMTVSAAKGLDKDEKEKKSGNISAGSVMPEPASVPSMQERMLRKRMSKESLNMVF